MDLINCPLSSFAVCADPRAAEAKAAHQQKLHETYNRSAKYVNDSAYYVTGLHRTAIGLSRTLGDIDSSLIRAQGSIRGKAENVLREYLSSKESGLSSQEGRSRTAGRKSLMGLLTNKSILDYQMRNLVTDSFIKQVGAYRQFKTEKAKNRQSLGLPPNRLPPTLIPRTNRLTQALKIGLTIGGAIATGGSSLAASSTFLGTHGAALGSAMSGIGSAIEY